MANELTWDTVTGLTINAYRFKTDDNVLLANPASNEVWGTGGRTAADYAIAMSESGSSGHYSVDFNDGGAIAAGVYRLVYAIQSGASPANSDRKIAKAEICWDGTAEITKSVIDTVVDTIAGDVVNIDGIVPAAAGDAMTLVADQAVNVTKIAGAAVNTATAQLGVNIVSEDNIDFGAAKKTSLNAATPDLSAITSDKNSYKATSVTVSDKTGFSLSTAGILAIWHQALTSITSVGSVGKKLKDWVVGQITGTDNIDFSATQKASLNTATPDLTAITSDKDSYKATGFNTVVPDVAGTAATLHGVTDGKVDAVQSDVTLIKAETDLFDGMIIEDSSGNQFTIAALVNAPTAEMDSDELHTALDSYTNKGDYKAAGFATPTNVTDAHATTDAKIDVTDGLVGGLNDISPAEVNTEVDSALSDYGANTVVPDVAGTAATLHGTTNGLINALNNITVADILAGVIEGTITLQQSLRGLMAAEFGKASGGDTTSIKFRNLADTKNRITETVDANGNRTSVTLDLT